MLPLNIFKLIGELFEFLFIPYKWFRLTVAKQDLGWWKSNGVNWVFIFILILLLGYWISQALKFKREGTEDRV